MKKFNLIIICLLTFTVNTSAQELVLKEKLEPPTIESKQTLQKRSEVWIPGQWIIENNTHKWVNGYWELKKMGQVYICGKWKKIKQGYVWETGYWKSISMNQWISLYS